jgi:hypothetical protein
MKGRSKSRQELSPGPGAYDPKEFLTKDKTPSYKVSNSKRNEIVNRTISELPGPGAYSSINEFDKNIKSVRKIGCFKCFSSLYKEDLKISQRMKYLDLVTTLQM